ncbi:MAG: hypothetical protein GYB65_23685 [Chloroflexi bacterium]|nr:hypothetical protein [Chloroflexota bacterium]
MTSPSTLWIDRPTRAFVGLLAIGLAVFLLAVGLGSDQLPFPPEADYSDAVTSHWPNALFLRRAVLEDHAFPLWRPLIMSGQPFAANPLNKVWYPPQWLALVFPPALHLNLLTWLHLVIAGAGAWTWGRSTGLQPWPAALAGVGYAFAPRLVAAVGVGHLDLVYAAAWVPWLLWAVYRVVQPSPGRYVALWLGLFGALCFLADVRLSTYAFVVAAVYLLWRWRETPALYSRTGQRQLGYATGSAVLLAVGLTAPQWVGLLLVWPDLSRVDISLADAALHSLEPGQWIGLLIGDHGGSGETLVYGGVSTLVLAIVALLLRPRAFTVWIGVLVFLMVYALGDNFILWTALNRLIPPLRWWRVPPRVWLVAALILPYLAAWGAQLLAERPPDERRAARLSVVALTGGGLVCSISSLVLLVPALELTAVLGTFALPAVALVLALAIFGRLPTQTITILFALVVALDVVWIDLSLVDGQHQREWLDPYEELAEYLRDEGAVRVYSPSYSLPQQAAAYWDIQQFGGVDPFQLADYVVAAEAATGVQASGYSVTIPAYEGDEEGDISTANRDAPINPDLLGQWLVTHVVSAFEIDTEGLELAREFELPEGTGYVYRNTTAPDVTLAWDGPNRVEVWAAGPFEGRVFTVAPGRWDDEESGFIPPDDPGQLAQIGTSTYQASEVWLGALGGGIGIGLALAWWWRVNRA